jgi:TfoX/Sxy family transcriptional regulator of competence genes
MATSSSTIEYITDQLVSVPGISTRKMFGEYALYCGKKVVALICDDTLFVKITPEGKEFVDDKYKEGAPYPGAKPWMLIDADLLEDRDWISALIKITEVNLEEPKPKKKK